MAGPAQQMVAAAAVSADPAPSAAPPVVVAESFAFIRDSRYIIL